MDESERRAVRSLLEGPRAVALSVVVEGRPLIGLLPFALEPGYQSGLVLASDLARHTRGLGDGAPFAALFFQDDGAVADPYQIARLGLEGTVEPIERPSAGHDAARLVYEGRVPSSRGLFQLGDFRLYRLRFERGRAVLGFGRARTVNLRTLAEIAAEAGSA